MEGESRVTVNAGIRWEPFFSQNLTDGAIYNWDRDLPENVTSGEFLKRRPASCTRATPASRPARRG